MKSKLIYEGREGGLPNMVKGIEIVSTILVAHSSKTFTHLPGIL